MKILLLLSAIFLLTVSADKCNSKKKTEPGVYKAKLETKALCMNYTLRLLEGDLDTSMITASWTDESTGKSHTNVFGLAITTLLLSALLTSGSTDRLISTSMAGKDEPCKLLLM